MSSTQITSSVSVFDKNHKRLEVTQNAIANLLRSIQQTKWLPSDQPHVKRITEQFHKHLNFFCSSDLLTQIETIDRLKEVVVMLDKTLSKQSSENEELLRLSEKTYSLLEAYVYQKPKETFIYAHGGKSIISYHFHPNMEVIKKSSMRPAIAGEIDIHSSLHKTPYIPELLAKGDQYFFMEKFDGNLVQLQECSNLDIPDIIRQILTAVANVHSQGYLHNDVKLDNFLYKTRGQRVYIVLTDFEEASKVETCPSQTNTTLAYCPPELNPISENPKTLDAWSCGVSIYAFVTGFLFFTAPKEKKGLPRIFKAHNQEYFTESIETNIQDEALKDILHQLLNFDPEKRALPQDLLSHSYFNQCQDNAKS